MARQFVFLTDTALITWPVPADWSDDNTIECIGGGGGAAQGVRNASYGAGGGGGGYSRVANVTGLSGSIIVNIGEGGTSATQGGDTWFNGSTFSTSSVGARGGGTGTAGLPSIGGAGGAAANGIGTTRYSGGNGAPITPQNAAGGGGGAAGPNGNGAGAGTGAYQWGQSGGGGGGGGGGTAGGTVTAVGVPAGSGGNNFAGSGAGTGGTTAIPNGGAGIAGGGGGGGFAATAAAVGGHGGAGGPGSEWDVSYGAGGGGGGGGATNVNTPSMAAGNGGNGGLYGGGGGSGGAGGGATGGTEGISAIGAQGIIVISYEPRTEPPVKPITLGNATDLGNNGLPLFGDQDESVGPRAVLTAPHALGLGSNLLLVGVQGAFPPVDDITGVTYGGRPLIELAKATSGAADKRNVYLYGLAYPPAGIHDVRIESAGDHYLTGLAIDYAGATIAGFSVATNTADSTADTSLTTTIEVTRPDSWVMVLESGYSNNQPPLSGVGTAGPRIYHSPYGDPAFFDSGAGVPAGPYTFTTHRTAPIVSLISHLAVAFAPAGEPEPISIELEPVEQPLETAGELVAQVYSTAEIPHPVLRFIPFVQHFDMAGTIAARIDARIILRATPIPYPPVQIADDIAARITARPTALDLDFAEQPRVEASGALSALITPTSELPHPTVRFIPFAQRFEGIGRIETRIYARPLPALDPIAPPILPASGELAARITAQPTALRVNFIQQKLDADGFLSARILARILSLDLEPRDQLLEASGELRAEIYSAIVIPPVSIIEETIEQLRARARIFEGRVAGAANFAAGLQNYNASLPAPAAYVIPLSQESEPNQTMIGLVQMTRSNIGVVVEFNATADRRGQVPAMNYATIQEAIFKALLNWPPTFCRTPNNQGFQFTGSRMLDLDRARLFYQWEFGLDWQLDDQRDGWQFPAEPLQTVEMDIHRAPMIEGRRPAIMMRVNMQPPTYWDHPQRPTIWDGGRTVWMA